MPSKGPLLGLGPGGAQNSAPVALGKSKADLAPRKGPHHRQWRQRPRTKCSGQSADLSCLQPKEQHRLVGGSYKKKLSSMKLQHIIVMLIELYFTSLCHLFTEVGHCSLRAGGEEGRGILPYWLGSSTWAKSALW